MRIWININVSEEIDKLLTDLWNEKELNQQLQDSIQACHQRVRELEDDTLRLKMLLNGENTMMNSLPNAPVDKDERWHYSSIVGPGLVWWYLYGDNYIGYVYI